MNVAAESAARFGLVSWPRWVAFVWEVGGKGWSAVGASDDLAEAEHFARTRGKNGVVRKRGTGPPEERPAGITEPPAPLRRQRA